MRLLMTQEFLRGKEAQRNSKESPIANGYAFNYESVVSPFGLSNNDNKSPINALFILYLS